MKLKNYFLTMLFFVSLTTLAQTYTVSGVVTDDDNDPLPAVSVLVKGTTNGTSSDFDGKYSLEVSQGDVLVYSFVGMTSQEITMDGTSTVDVILASGLSLDEVVVIGSRAGARTTLDSAVPVDVIDLKELAGSAPQINLNQILNYAAPSFVSNTQTISDGTDHVDPASLRGLGPDQVLVLINGKRRHTSSLVNVNGTFGRGSVGTDLNAIPAAAIRKIEILRDGAAAQYGSDAIAGVINIVLNETVNELTLNVTTGANFSSNANEQTGGVDGETVNVSANYGIALGENGGFINFTGDFDFRNDYNRMKEWEGGIFNAYNSVEWIANNSGMDIGNLSMADIQFAAQGVTHFDLATKTAIAGATSMGQLQDLLGFDTTDAELVTRGQTRSDYNMRIGQSRLRSGRFFANMAFPLDDNGTELYSTVGISSRRGNSAGFYRLPSQARAYTPLYINGFRPEINSTIRDKSVIAGIRGNIGDWSVDFSNTYGKNSFLFDITNTLNASMEGSSPLNFDAGGFAFAQNTTNLDFSNNFEDILNGFNVALGAEYRTETYDIVAGEEGSYGLYDEAGNLSDTASTDFFGNPRPAGAQVFPGFRPVNELSRTRDNVAGYVDVEATVSESLLLGAAVRYENYSDFGGTLNYKLTGRYKLNDNVNIRAAVNTGFRAPSLHQQYYNSVSTVFVGGEPFEVQTASNDSELARAFGIEKLKQEESASVSLGFTAKIPSANLKLTVDGYFIAIEDRVTYTGQFRGPGTNSEIDQILDAAGANRVAFFANAIDTETRGIDIVMTHKANLSETMTLRSDFAATFSQTRQVDDIHYPQLVVDNGLESSFFSETARVFLEEAVPNTKINLSHSLTSGKFTAFLRNVHFGSVTEAVDDTEFTSFQQNFAGKIVTDLSVGYKLTDALSVTVGANNLFDVYPDRNSTGDLDPTRPGVQNNRSGGRFDWSRRSQQFGIGGRFLFSRLVFVLK